MEMVKRFLMMLALMAAFAAWAGTREDFKANPKLSANNLQAYPLESELPALTPAPAGYMPFYINHYGRHGSRWLIDPNEYSKPVEWLAKADSAGKLTKRGREVLAILRTIKAASSQRLGELSDLGAEQHQAITRRMFRNFPEVFAGDAPVDAKSTVVIRCILSMQNAVDMLRSLNPNLRIRTDASQHDMYYMNYNDKPTGALINKVYKEHLGRIKNTYLHPERLLKKLVRDYAWCQRNFDTQQFEIYVWDVVSNLQSHHAFDHVDMSDLFDEQARLDNWNYNNCGWYIYAGNNAFTQHRAPYREAHLLRNFIGAADTAIMSGHNSATLRFGHESVVLPFVVLMGLNGMNYETADFSTLTDNWPCYKVFPMGANVQWIFYKKPGCDDILMKILLNEREATLPAEVKTDCAPYYHWKDVRAYFVSVLQKQPLAQ